MGSSSATDPPVKSGTYVTTDNTTAYTLVLYFESMGYCMGRRCTPLTPSTGTASVILRILCTPMPTYLTSTRAATSSVDFRLSGVPPNLKHPIQPHYPPRYSQTSSSGGISGSTPTPQASPHSLRASTRSLAVFWVHPQTGGNVFIIHRLRLQIIYPGRQHSETFSLPPISTTFLITA